jgi:hypothetical protein
MDRTPQLAPRHHHLRATVFFMRRKSNMACCWCKSRPKESSTHQYSSPPKGLEPKGPFGGLLLLPSYCYLYYYCNYLFYLYYYYA